MAGPGGQVIGRVSVKVLPDTDDFKKRAKTALERIEKSLSVTISTKADMTGAKRDMLEGIRAINAENAGKDSRKIAFRTRITTNGMNDAIRKAVRDLQNRAKGKKIDFEVGDLKAKGKVELELDRPSADKTEHDIKDWLNDISPLEVKVEPEWSSTAATVVRTRLATLTRPRTVQILPILNEGAVAKVATALAALSGARVLNNIFKRLKNTLMHLDESVPIIGTLSTAIAGLAGWGLSAASTLFALSSSLAQIGPAALLLPGLFGGIATGLGVTIAAFKDFNKVLPEVKDQLSKLQDTISKNFWEKAARPIRTMVDELLPEFNAGVAQSATQLGEFFGGFATNLKGALNPALKQMFDDLSKSIDIATGGTSAFANIITVLGQVGTSYLPELAQWFVNISTHFSEFLSKAASDGSLNDWITVALQNIKDLGRVLSNLGGILAGISRAATEAGGSTLGTLADALERIHTTVDSPAFQHGLIDVLRAAHQAMDLIAEKSGPAVKNFFTELGKLLTDILPLVGSIIGTALGAIADALSQPAIVNGVKAVFGGIADAVTALAPAMQPLGQALGALLQVVATMLTVFGPLIAAALVPLANLLVAIAPYVQQLVQLLGGALTNAVNALAPIILKLASALGGGGGGGGGLSGGLGGLKSILPSIAKAFDQLLSAVGPLVAAIGGALLAIMPPLVQILGQVLAAVIPLVTTLAKALTPIFGPLGQAIAQIVTALQPFIATVLKIVTAVLTPLIEMLSRVLADVLPPLGEAISRVVEALQPFLNALLAIVNFLMPVLVPVLEFIIGILADALVNAINGVGLVLEGLVEIFQGAWNIIVGVLEIAWGLIQGIFTGNFGTLKEGWHDLWTGILTFLKGIWDTLLGALEVWWNVGILGLARKGITGLKSVIKAGWDAVKGFFKGALDSITGSLNFFWTGVKGLVGDGMAALKSLFSNGWAAVKGAASDAWAAIKSVLSNAWSGIKTTVSNGISDVVDFVKGLPSKCKQALGNLSSTLINAGKQLIQGFINGITSMFNAVKGKLSDLTHKLTDWKGPESLDRVLLVGAGQLVIDGFIKGLESRYDAVRKSLKGLTEDVAGTEFDVPGASSIHAAAGATGALSGALANSSSEGGGVTKVLKYYAAPGSSISSEEDLFAAANRARMGW